MKNTQNSAFFLLALLKNGNATVRLTHGRLEIGPASLANRLAPKIREHKKNLVRFLLDQDCVKCGLEMASGKFIGSTGSVEPEKLIYERVCPSCSYSVKRQLPDFPVFDKSGKEI